MMLLKSKYVTVLQRRLNVNRNDSVWSAGEHAHKARRARHEAIDLFFLRTIPCIRERICLCIGIARYHEAKRDAIAAGLPVVV